MKGENKNKNKATIQLVQIGGEKTVHKLIDYSYDDS